MSVIQDKIEIEVAETQWFFASVFSELPAALKWFLIFAIIAILPAYLFTKAVSHGYYSKKYAASIVAAKPSFSNPLAPAAGPVTINTIGANTYTAAATITNQNLDLSAKSISYEFQFFNAQNQQVAAVDDTTFLLPNQNKFLVVPKLTSADQITSAKLVVSNNITWQKRLSIPQVSIQPSAATVGYQPNPVALTVQGTYLNNSPYRLGKVHLTFVLYDAQNNILGASQRDDFSLAPYERRAYTQLWPGVYNGNITRVQVQVETNTLDPSNLTAIQQPSGAASDLNRP